MVVEHVAMTILQFSEVVKVEVRLQWVEKWEGGKKGKTAIAGHLAQSKIFRERKRKVWQPKGRASEAKGKMLLILEKRHQGGVAEGAVESWGCWVGHVWRSHSGGTEFSRQEESWRHILISWNLSPLFHHVGPRAAGWREAHLSLRICTVTCLRPVLPNLGQQGWALERNCKNA